MKTAIFVLNFGGPNKLSEVRPFLFNLFNQPEILIGVPKPIRFFLAGFISLVKGFSSKKYYALIGGGSPQLFYSRKQADQLEKALNKTSLFSKNEIRVFTGMRAWQPFIGDVSSEIKKWQPDQIILLPLFPQASITTSVSCINEARKHLAEYHEAGKLIAINGWHNNVEYIQLLRKTIDEQLAQIKKEDLPKTHVLFSAHSLPMKTVKKGDVYPAQTQASVSLAAEGLPVNWSLSYQSRNGPLPWLEPYTQDEITKLANEKVQNLIIVPVSFVSDHVETMYELDMKYADLAREKGITNVLRSRTFNEDVNFTKILIQLVKDNIKQTKKGAP